jgi:hypothetical protein
MQHSQKGLEFRDVRVDESKKGRRMNKFGKEIGDEGNNPRENKQVNSERRKEDEEAGRKEQTKQINDREALKKQRKDEGEHEK